jgi:hypothetical protein
VQGLRFDPQHHSGDHDKFSRSVSPYCLPLMTLFLPSLLSAFLLHPVFSLGVLLRLLILKAIYKIEILQNISNLDFFWVIALHYVLITPEE